MKSFSNPTVAPFIQVARKTAGKATIR